MDQWVCYENGTPRFDSIGLHELGIKLVLSDDLAGAIPHLGATASGGGDQFGAGNKFITPTIVNGKVFVGFVGTPNGVAVYGLLPQ